MRTSRLRHRGFVLSLTLLAVVSTGVAVINHKPDRSDHDHAVDQAFADELMDEVFGLLMAYYSLQSALEEAGVPELDDAGEALFRIYSERLQSARSLQTSGVGSDAAMESDSARDVLFSYEALPLDQSIPYLSRIAAMQDNDHSGAYFAVDILMRSGPEGVGALMELDAAGTLNAHVLDDFRFDRLGDNSELCPLAPLFSVCLENAENCRTHHGFRSQGTMERVRQLKALRELAGIPPPTDWTRLKEWNCTLDCDSNEPFRC